MRRRCRDEPVPDAGDVLEGFGPRVPRGRRLGAEEGGGDGVVVAVGAVVEETQVWPQSDGRREGSMGGRKARAAQDLPLDANGDENWGFLFADGSVGDS